MVVFMALTALAASEGKLGSAAEAAAAGKCGPVLKLSDFGKMKPTAEREAAARAFAGCMLDKLNANVDEIGEAMPALEDAFSASPAPDERARLADLVVEVAQRKGGKSLVKRATAIAPDSDALWSAAIALEPNLFEGFLESVRVTPRPSAAPILATACADKKDAVLADCVGVMEAVHREGGDTASLATLLMALGQSERDAGRSAMPQYQRLVEIDPENGDFQMLQLSEVIRGNPAGTLEALSAQTPGPIGRCTNVSMFAVAAKRAESKEAVVVANQAVTDCLKEKKLPDALKRDLQQLEAREK